MTEHIGQKLSFLDRYLTVWIFAAMILGVGLPFYSRHGGLYQFISSRDHQIPIAVGLILMMYPPSLQSEIRGNASSFPQWKGPRPVVGPKTG